jgi:hypothetical protein
MPREVVVGTSDAQGGAAVATADDTPGQEMPTLVAVEEHLQRLRYELCGDHHAAGGYASAVRIPAHDVRRCASLVDLLDQLRYWAVEEATTFSGEPSRLAAAEAPEAVVACACSGRPRVMAQALSVVQPMLRHRQTASELRRVVREVQQRQQRMRDHRGGSNSDDEEQVRNTLKSREEREEEDGRVGEGGDDDAPAADVGSEPLLPLLAEVMQRHAGVVPLLTEAIATATCIVQVAVADVAESSNNSRDDDNDASALEFVRNLVEVFHTTPLVYLIECAMRRFGEVMQLQVEGVKFFAALIDLPTLTEDYDRIEEEERDLHEEADTGAGRRATSAPYSSTTSMADVVAHSDGVLAVLRNAMQHHRQHLTLCRGALHVWCVCSQAPSCRVPLLRHGVYTAALQQLAEAGPYTPDVFHTAAEVVGCFIPLLDALQRRTLLWTLRGILHRRPQLEMIELVLALLLAVLTVVRGPYNSNNSDDGGENRGRAEGLAGVPTHDPFALYARCARPPQFSEVPVHSPSPGAAAESRPRRLQLSPLLFQPSPASAPFDGSGGDTWAFMLHCCALPQLVSGLHGYFTTCEVVDEADAAEVQRVCTLAQAVLSFF